MRTLKRIKLIIIVAFRAAKRFDRERGFEAAAALAFYTVVSLFPLLLLLFAGASLLIEEQEVKNGIRTALLHFIPTLSQQLITKNLEQVLRVKEGFSIVAAVFLIWTASGVFSGLVENINRAWSKSYSRAMVINRLLAVATGFGLFAIMMFLFMIQHGFNAIRATYWASYPVIAPLLPSSRLITYAFGFVSILALYKLVPLRPVSWRDAAIGSVVSTSAAALVTTIYGIYLSARLEQYSLIYGSLTTILGFMLWTYAMHTIVLYGAHISAQSFEAKRRR